MARRRREPSPEEVLAGRASVDVHGLVALIHAVNPTGRGLSAREEQRRYAQKAALQSLLLRRFPDLVRVEESKPGEIALSLRETFEPAAHCPIDALDEDVCSWVRFRLDTGEETEEAGRPAARRATDGRAWQARARAALARYDYEDAEAVLRHACAADPSDPAPAIALVELLVDQLGDGSRALALFAELDARARSERRVAGAIAVAAALALDVPLARALLAQVEGERASEAWAHLGRHAMASGDDALAREARAALSALSPAHALVRQLDDHLEQCRLRARADAEAALVAAEAAGADAHELEALARSVQAEYPRSPAAARILRELDEAARRTRVDALLALADERAPIDDAAAVALWREALALGADPELFDARLHDAEARLEHARVAQTASEIAAAFARGETEAALVRALDAGPAVLLALAERLDASALALLRRAERIRKATPSARAKRCARAALGWERAERALDARDVATAARELAPEAKLLERMDEVLALRERLGSIEREEQAGQRRGALDAARSALARGELDEASRCLARLRASELDGELRAAHDELIATIERMEHERTMDATLDAREREGRWLDVTALCEQALARPTGPARARALTERAERARSYVAELYRFASLGLRPGEGSLPPAGRGCRIEKLITDAADGMVVAVTGAAGWIVVRWIDPRDGGVQRAVCFRPPEASPAAEPRSLRVAPDRLSIATEDALVVSVARTGERLLDAVALDASARGAGVDLVGGSDYAWQLRGNQDAARIFDTRTGQVRRTLPDWKSMAVMTETPLVLRCSEEAGRWSFDPFDARGTSLGRRLELPGEPLWGVFEDGALYALCRRPAGTVGPSHALARCDVESATSTIELELDLPAEAKCAIAVSADAFFVIASGIDGALEARDRLDPGAEPRWCVPIASGDLVKVGPSVVALLSGANGRTCVPLTLEAAPAVPCAASPCFDEGPSQPGVLPLSRAAQRSRPADARARDAERRGVLAGRALARLGADGDEDAMSETLAYLCESSLKGSRQAFDVAMDEIQKRERLGPSLTAWVVKRAMDSGRWARALSTLDELERSVLDEALAEWCCYARGLSAYGSGDVEGALSAWARASGGSASASECRRLSERVRRLHDGGPKESGDGHAAVLAAIRVSDALASAGNVAGAIRALDVDCVWAAGEPQSLYRLAALHLGLERRTPAEWLRTLEVLAELTDLTTKLSWIVLAAPGAHWPEERLGDVRDRARRWLDEARPPRG